MKRTIILVMFFCSVIAKGQELYVYTEPASNMPARSISAKFSASYITKQNPDNRFMQRYTPEIMFGINKNWMLHMGGTFADMHTKNFRWESVYLYGKYRFLSNDELYSHFRMAAFADVAYNRSPFQHDEVSLQGDNSVQLGIIATQLWGKFALSGTASHTQVLDKDRNDKSVVYIPSRTEVLAQQSLDRKAYYVDRAPAVQLIFNSNVKLNIGYRFQLKGDMHRMARNS